MYIMYIDESSREVFLKNKEVVEKMPLLERIVGLKEVVEILATSESTLRRNIANGEYLEEKEDYRKVGTTIVFNMEAILNRRYMSSEEYWFLKEEYEKKQLNELLFGEGLDKGLSVDDSKLDAILKNVEAIRVLLEVGK